MVGSLSGAEHLINSNLSVQSTTQREQKSLVE